MQSGDCRGLQNRRSLSLMAMVGSTPTRFRQLKAASRKFQPGDCVFQRNNVGSAFNFKLSYGVKLSHSGDLRRLRYSQAGLGREPIAP